jgi:hypothetical protein
MTSFCIIDSNFKKFIRNLIIWSKPTFLEELKFFGLAKLWNVANEL